ncbi:MAG TPA: pyruvate kinase [Longimicrobiaceae bacterium]|nr:pyruvate kinase [Longimicrobiaceae bacterium]
MEHAAVAARPLRHSRLPGSRTRLACSVGRATSDEALVAALLERGVTDFRFPLGKADVAEQLAWSARVHDLAAERGARVRLSLDLPGSKPRLANREPLKLARGTRVELRPTPDPAEEIPGALVIGTTGFDFAACRPGDVLVVGDGENAFRVEAAAPGALTARALTDWPLGRRKGISVEGRPLAHRCLTAQDQAALRAVERWVFSSVMASFVESAEDVARVRRFLAALETARGRTVRVAAKVETARAVANVEEICAAADAVVLARGDLLVSVGPVEFPAACARVVQAAREAGRPVIVATQLLSTLGSQWLPHRSELEALARLVRRGVDGLLLTSETAGPDPLRTVDLALALIARYSR